MAIDSGKLVNRMDRAPLSFSTGILIVALVASLVFLWLGYKQARSFSAVNANLKTALDETLPKAGDALRPTMSGRTPDGNEVSLLAEKQKSLWVLFSIHCHICMGESHSWSELAKKVNNEGTAVYFLSMDKGPEVAEFSRSHPQLRVVAPSREILRSLRLTTIPYYLILDSAGVVRWIHRGALSISDAAALHSRAGSDNLDE